MNNFLRTIIAGWGAKKLGGGCISTIIVFIIIYYALGTCNSHPVQTGPQKHSGVRLPTHSPPLNLHVIPNTPKIIIKY
ncbi:MAG: hypothetical protein ABI863_22085 [Ginsengibacter sp.]